MSIVADGKVVLFHYTLTDDDGAVLDTSRERGEPMPYLHGASNIVPGLETQMTGKAVGDRFVADVAPEDGYGEHNGMSPQPVPRQEFPPNVQLRPGMQLMAQTEGGQAIPIWIASVEADTVFIDMNHPLAGKTLHFDVEVTGIRDATADEQAHGHPHGPDGHHHH
ncbi:MAG: peptidylprolyl isomerase [Myxococcota bacterium]